MIAAWRSARATHASPGTRRKADLLLRKAAGHQPGRRHPDVFFGQTSDLSATLTEGSPSGDL